MRTVTDSGDERCCGETRRELRNVGRSRRMPWVDCTEFGTDRGALGGSRRIQRAFDRKKEMRINRTHTTWNDDGLHYGMRDELWRQERHKGRPRTIEKRSLGRRGTIRLRPVTENSGENMKGLVVRQTLELNIKEEKYRARVCINPANIFIVNDTSAFPVPIVQ